MITAASLVLVVSLSSLQTEGAMEAKIRCDDQATSIYIDGMLDGWTLQWEKVWTKNISGKSRLVAVRCYNDYFSGGLIASFANGLVSDETWKCRNYTFDNSWLRLDTDDSSSPWNSAYVIPPSLVPQTWITSGTFPDSAKWIWKDSSFKSKVSSLCRADLGVSMYIKCDNQATVYADGVTMSPETIYNTKTKILLPRTTHVIAIRGFSWANTAYIQAIIYSGYRTDTSWRCTDGYDSDWNLEHYDDSHWDQATDYGPGDIGDDVRKIWTANIVDDRYIYCRGHFECGCEYTCKEHKNEYDFHCLCPEGFTLAEDGRSCDKVDVCGTRNPGCEDVCVNTDQSYKCACSAPGYELDTDRHSCINIDECVRGMHNCSHKCVDSEGAFKCDCLKGFRLQQDGVSCYDTPECDKNNGNCDQLCLSTNGSYTCDCRAGYELTNDSDKCSNIDECDRGTHNCTGIMSCEDTEGGFNCVCPVGYEMQRDKETCRDIDECELQNKPCNHTCINTAGSYMCSCSDGYSLAADGYSCLPTSPDETKASNTGLIAGIVTVTTLLVIVIVALLIGGFVWMRRRRARQDNEPDKAGSGDYNSRTANHVYYNVGRAAQRGEPSYENMQNQPDITGSSREQAHSNRQVQESMSGDEAETTAGTVHDLPHVYYNIGRVGNGDETPYEDISGLQNGALRDVSQPTEPAQAQASAYASLNRQLEENDERSPYTDLA